MAEAKTRAEIVQRLTEHLAALKQDFHIRSLSLFGSAARDELRPGSDVDVLVEFEEPPGFIEFMRLKFRLEALLGLSVDLATPRALKPCIRPRVEQELVHVTELSPVSG